eukprot:TRINITY_DN1360_c0_g2_i4.p1 TRINITY_DN1360_c0_g2~~TRINITY_DN1360_c0_g2_i4.p1  ORF type:complete len:512 (-),score=188.62 TRINITY_DN1360_c0_g2_i4:66-1601(-)
MSSRGSSSSGSQSAAAAQPRRKQAAIDIKEYESAAFYTKFNAIHEHLVKTEGDDPLYSSKSLSILTAQLQQFMEEVAGRDAYDRIPFTKIPSKLFQDYRANGTLHQILSTCNLYRAGQDWRRFDFKSPAKRDKNIELLNLIQQSLEQSGVLKWPQVFFTPSVDKKQVTKLSEIVRRHHGKIATSAAKATHIIEVDPNAEEPDADVEYLRTIATNGKQSLVHYWYYPDSYDTWIPAQDVEGEAEDEETHKGAWKVAPRWITDTDIFSEWMNEMDYEKEEEEDDVPEVAPRGGRGKKGKAQAAAGRKKVEEAPEPAPSTPTVKQVKTPKGKGKRGAAEEEHVDVEASDEEAPPVTTKGSTKKGKGDEKKVDTPAALKIKIPRAASSSPIGSPDTNADNVIRISRKSGKGGFEIKGKGKRGKEDHDDDENVDVVSEEEEEEEEEDAPASKTKRGDAKPPAKKTKRGAAEEEVEVTEEKGKRSAAKGKEKEEPTATSLPRHTRAAPTTRSRNRSR